MGSKEDPDYYYHYTTWENLSSIRKSRCLRPSIYQRNISLGQGVYVTDCRPDIDDDQLRFHLFHRTTYKMTHKLYHYVKMPKKDIKKLGYKVKKYPDGRRAFCIVTGKDGIDLTHIRCVSYDRRVRNSSSASHRISKSPTRNSSSLSNIDDVSSRQASHSRRARELSVHKHQVKGRNSGFPEFLADITNQRLMELLSGANIREEKTPIRTKPLISKHAERSDAIVPFQDNQFNAGKVAQKSTRSVNELHSGPSARNERIHKTSERPRVQPKHNTERTLRNAQISATTNTRNVRRPELNTQQPLDDETYGTFGSICSDILLAAMPIVAFVVFYARNR